MDRHSSILSEEEEINEIFPPVNLYYNYSSVLIFDGLPITEEEKADKLATMLQNSVITQKEPEKIKNFWMPSENGKTKGFAFVEFVSASEALKRRDTLNGFKFMKYTLSVISFDEFQELQKIPSKYEAPTEEKYKPPENLSSWLTQSQSLEGADQFVTRFGDETQVSWFGNPPEIDPASLQKWQRVDDVDWSPSGTYLVVYLKLGIALYGGPNWTKQKTFNHEGVRMVQFSPCERYLVTFSPELAERDKPQEFSGIHIWDVRKSKLIRSFPHNTENPAFKWSHDGSYFSKLVNGSVYVWQTPEMKLVADDTGKQGPLKLQGNAKDHEWSPTDNYLCIYVPESGNIPARVMLLDYPSLKNIGTQALVNVDGCHIHWHPQGDYLGVKVDRHAKNKKQSFTSFEFFRVRSKNVPIEGLELKDRVVAFAWEPKGQHFAIIHSEASATGTAGKLNISIYSMGANTLSLSKTLDKKSATHLYWSPAGRHLLLVGLRTMNGTVEFFDVQTLSTLSNETHSSCTDIEWDPTGRYVCTYSSYWRNKNENGYKIWSFRGKELLTVNKDPFFQFLWRPRPKSVLSQAQLAELQKPSVFKQYQTKYKRMDREKEDAKTKKIREEMLRTREEYRALQKKRMEQWKADAEWRKSIGIPDDREEDFLVVEECVEEVLEEKFEVLE